MYLKAKYVCLCVCVLTMTRHYTTQRHFTNETTEAQNIIAKDQEAEISKTEIIGIILGFCTLMLTPKFIVLTVLFRLARTDYTQTTLKV